MSNPDPVDLDSHPLAAGPASGDGVPVVDVEPLLRGGDTRADERACASIAAASREWGFFQIVGHGLSDALQEAVAGQMRIFFALPAARKETVLRTRENPWGYYHNELTKNQRDRKEVFDFTRDDSVDIYGASNRWPDGSERFRSTMLDYLQACERLSMSLLRAFCRGLGVDPDYLGADFGPRHTGFIRLNHYPVEDPLEGSTTAHLPTADLGVHHHTDAGAFTVLLQDEVGGLQVYRGGAWHDVPPIAGALVVNTGDMMQVWSNDSYRAAIHRVLAMSRRERFSIPFFFNPAAGTVVEPLPSTVREDRPARYRPIDWAEFRGRRTDGDYADYGPEVQISQYRIPGETG